MKLTANIKPISMSHYSIFVLEEKDTDNILPALSITMRTDICEYLKRLVDADQEKKDS